MWSRVTGAIRWVAPSRCGSCRCRMVPQALQPELVTVLWCPWLYMRAYLGMPQNGVCAQNGGARRGCICSRDTSRAAPSVRRGGRRGRRGREFGLENGR